MKLLAVDDPFFNSAMDASETLFKYLGDGLPAVKNLHVFREGGKTCFRPSATMLTSLEQFPNATTVDFPPSENRRPFIEAMNASGGAFVFSADNEVLFCRDTRTDEYVLSFMVTKLR